MTGNGGTSSGNGEQPVRKTRLIGGGYGSTPVNECYGADIDRKVEQGFGGSGKPQPERQLKH